MKEMTDVELHFSYWLDECLEHDLIVYWEFHPDKLMIFDQSIIWYEKQLKTKTKHVPFTLLREWTYQADFLIVPIDEQLFVDLNDFKAPGGLFYYTNDICYIDTKSEFTAPNKRMSNDKLPLVQKALWNLKEIYINKTIPFQLFEKTFTPQKVISEYVYKKDYRDKPAGSSRLKFKPRTIKEYLDTRPF